MEKKVKEVDEDNQPKPQAVLMYKNKFGNSMALLTKVKNAIMLVL